MMLSKSCKTSIWCDFLRLCNASCTQPSKPLLLRSIFNNDVFASIFWFRVASDLQETNHGGVLFNVFARYMQKKYRRRTCIELEPGTKIGNGLRIAHRGTLVVAGKAVIGSNCTLHQNVTIGRSFGLEGGTPIIGNNVVVFPGTQIIGKIAIGDNVVIGAGSLVIKDVPSCCVVGGNPARVLSQNSNDEDICAIQWRGYFS